MLVRITLPRISPPGLAPVAMSKIQRPALRSSICARVSVTTAWIVLVPAEFLGVTSGLGYAINDARDTLSYDRLAALVLLIGIIGYGLDALITLAIQRVRWTPTT